MLDQTNRKVLHTCKMEKKTVEEERDSARWEATTVFDASRTGADERLKEINTQIAQEVETLETLRADTDLFLVRSRMAKLKGLPEPDRPEPRETSPEPDDPLAVLRTLNEQADAQLLQLEQLRSPRLFHNGGIIGIVLLIALATTLPAMVLIGPLTGGILGAVATLVLGTAAGIGFHSMARKKVSALYPDLRRTLYRAGNLASRLPDWAAETDKRRRAEIEETRNLELTRAQRNATRRMTMVEERRDGALKLAEEDHAERVQTAQAQRDEDLQRVEQTIGRRLEEIQSRYESESQAWQIDEQRWRHELKDYVDREWGALSDRWRSGMEQLKAEVAAIRETCDAVFLDWDQERAGAEAWRPPQQAAPAIRFGAFDDRAGKASRWLAARRNPARAGPARVELPALLPFPEGGSMLLRARGDGRGPAVATLQAVMLRMLTSNPPGKVRFTIIDPVGLGQNFAAFMHLADFDETLVNSRIWTESQHIEQRLADLTEHMEKVIQKYLRNEYASIQEYNEMAGEVAEPFRVLVVANFPANFSEATARRLLSIAQSGPRCGVYTLITVDESLPMPPGITLSDLETHATRLDWRDGRFVWKDEDFNAYPLRLDAPPPDEPLTGLLQKVGVAAEGAGRVEVPFEIIAPPEDQWWTGDSSQGLDVPLGRVGATKLQHMRWAAARRSTS